MYIKSLYFFIYRSQKYYEKYISWLVSFVSNVSLLASIQFIHYDGLRQYNWKSIYCIIGYIWHIPSSHEEPVCRTIEQLGIIHSSATFLSLCIIRWKNKRRKHIIGKKIRHIFNKNHVSSPLDCVACTLNMLSSKLFGWK